MARASEVEKLAAHISSISNDRQLPKMLLRLEKILGRVAPGSAQAATVKQEIWKFDLLQLLLTALRRDFTNVSGSWETGVRLADLAYNLMVNMYVSKSEDPDEVFEKQLAPRFCENLLILSKRIQDCFQQVIDRTAFSEFSPEKLVQLFDKTIALLINYLRQKRSLIKQTVHSPWFLQLFVTDDTETPLSMLKLLRSCISYQADLCRTMDKSLFESITEEMIYDLATGESAEVAGDTIRTLLTVVRNFPDSLESMLLRYNGLRLLLTKWTGLGGFGRELQDLIRLLDSKSSDRATMELKIRAATMIQSYWRSFRERKRISQANKSLGKFQRKIREKQQVRKKQSEAERMRNELQYEIVMRRKKTLNEKREMQVQLMRTLPASTVRSFAQKEQQEAATKIQARYKAYRERSKLEEKKTMAKVVKATVTIQRAVRRWLRALQYERMMEKLHHIAPISEELRAEIMEDIAKQQYLRKPKTRNREELTDLYRTSQAMMHEFVIKSLKTPKEDLERDAMLSCLETDANLLQSAPKLESVEEIDVYKFTSNSTPAQIHAQLRHKNTLRRLECTGINWWRALRLEEEDEVDEEASYLENRKNVLFIDGRMY